MYVQGIKKIKNKMGNIIEINPGEIRVKFDSPTKGKITFAELGLNDEQLNLPSGNLRMVFGNRSSAVKSTEGFQYFRRL